MQIALHERNDFIHTSESLHAHADAIEKYNHAIENSEAFDFILKKKFFL